MYKTAISNIAWGNVDERPFLEYIASKGLYGIELAPSIIWEEPVKATETELAKYRKRIESYGLRIVSFHALLYTRPDLKIFDTEEVRVRTKEYLANLARGASYLGCHLMVFGSPRSRAIGSLQKEEADKIAIEFFHDTAEVISRYGVTLCIEPLSSKESDYINSYLQGINLVKIVNHPNFRLMLDVKSMYLNGENYNEVFKASEGYLNHVHVNDPDNTPPCSKGVDHNAVADALRKSSYDKVISLEVARSTGKSMDNVKKSIDVLHKVYCRRNDG